MLKSCGAGFFGLRRLQPASARERCGTCGRLTEEGLARLAGASAAYFSQAWGGALVGGADPLVPAQRAPRRPRPAARPKNQALPQLNRPARGRRAQRAPPRASAPLLFQM